MKPSTTVDEFAKKAPWYVNQTRDAQENGAAIIDQRVDNGREDIADLIKKKVEQIKQQ